jgi:hypothetical protein
MNSMYISLIVIIAWQIVHLHLAHFRTEFSCCCIWTKYFPSAKKKLVRYTESGKINDNRINDNRSNIGSNITLQDV